jgi:hypothetical protein
VAMKTQVKAGGKNLNHTETLRGVTMKTQVKAGRVGWTSNHNESFRGVATRTSIKAGQKVR